MANFKFKKANGKTFCRGGEISCIAIKDRYGRATIIPIPKDSKTLEVSVYGAGGEATAYYCEVCLIKVLDNMIKCLQEINIQI